MSRYFYCIYSRLYHISHYTQQAMFWNKSFQDSFFLSEDQSQHFDTPEEEHSLFFPVDGFLSIDRDRQGDRESSKECFASHIEECHRFVETDNVQSSQADQGSSAAMSLQLSNRTDSSKANPSLQLLKKNGLKQKNPSPSKNFLLYAWKKVLKCLKLSKNPKLQQCWQAIKGYKGSMESFNQLFNSLKTEEDLSAIFKSKILLQWLMLSPMDIFLKKAYLPYFRRLEQAHKKGYMNHLK